jgi:endoglucanase
MHKPSHSLLHRRHWLQWVGASAALSAVPGSQAASATAVEASWPRFAQQFMQADGRVVSDDGKLSRTYSEGQSYALFFALVANDRRRFDALLHWTRDNLSQGDLGQHLPAWLWGRQDDGAWGVIDSNSASDADLWIAYTLLQAGRLWRYRPYTAQGRTLAALIWQKEVAQLPGLGPSLLPGAQGFVQQPGQRWRLNPSYLPLQVLQALALEMQEPGWQQLADASLDLLVRSARQASRRTGRCTTASRAF